MPVKQAGNPDPRHLACRSLLQVIRHGHSLSAVRQSVYDKGLDPRDSRFIMELVQGVLRWRWKLEAILNACLAKPLRNKEHELKTLLCIALYECLEMQTPDYAVVDEAVKLVKKLQKSWARGLVNGVLRNFQRNREGILEKLDEEARLSHPDWLIDRIRADWPEDWRSILNNNNQRAPLTLRVNTRQVSRDGYVEKLAAAGIEAVADELSGVAIRCVEQVDVTSLPGFDSGAVSVQDAGAQLSAPLLSCETGMSVLDLCAAPGGKTCHVLEMLDDDIDMLAVDIDEERMRRVRQNLERLQLDAECLVADAASDACCEGRVFDRVLVDAPCSATGVIRRHPDIKSLRLADDIGQLADLQQQILETAWRSLKPTGVMLYVTCSVLRQENSEQIQRFIESHDDAEHVIIEADWGRACEVGRQLLPGDHDADGFYFALVRKRA